MAKAVVLVFDNDEAEQFVKDMQAGLVMVWERSKREGVTVEAGVLAILKPSTLANDGFSYKLPQGEDGVFRG